MQKINKKQPLFYWNSKTNTIQYQQLTITKIRKDCNWLNLNYNTPSGNDFRN